MGGDRMYVFQKGGIIGMQRDKVIERDAKSSVGLV